MTDKIRKYMHDVLDHLFRIEFAGNRNWQHEFPLQGHLFPASISYRRPGQSVAGTVAVSFNGNTELVEVTPENIVTVYEAVESAMYGKIFCRDHNHPLTSSSFWLLLRHLLTCDPFERVFLPVYAAALEDTGHVQFAEKLAKTITLSTHDLHVTSDCYVTPGSGRFGRPKPPVARILARLILNYCVLKEANAFLPGELSTPSYDHYSWFSNGGGKINWMVARPYYAAANDSLFTRLRQALATSYVASDSYLYAADWFTVKLRPTYEKLFQASTGEAVLSDEVYSFT